MFFAVCFQKIKYFKIHIYSSLIILVGVLLALISLKDYDVSLYSKYLCLSMMSLYRARL
jgi:hypothetical protein